MDDEIARESVEEEDYSIPPPAKSIWQNVVIAFLVLVIIVGAVLFVLSRRKVPLPGRLTVEVLSSEASTVASSSFTPQPKQDKFALAFPVLIPSLDGYMVAKQIVDDKTGIQNPTDFWVTFNLKNSAELIAISEDTVEQHGYTPPTRCAVRSCILVTTTPKGYVIYGESNSDSLGGYFIEYFTEIDTTLVKFHTINLVSESYDRPQLPTDRLHALVDSLQPITAEGFFKIPDGIMQY